MTSPSALGRSERFAKNDSGSTWLRSPAHRRGGSVDCRVVKQRLWPDHAEFRWEEDDRGTLIVLLMSALLLLAFLLLAPGLGEAISV